jgi:hypothetical protein
MWLVGTPAKLGCGNVTTRLGISMTVDPIAEVLLGRELRLGT